MYCILSMNSGKRWAELAHVTMLQTLIRLSDVMKRGTNANTKSNSTSYLHAVRSVVTGIDDTSALAVWNSNPKSKSQSQTQTQSKAQLKWKENTTMPIEYRLLLKLFSCHVYLICDDLVSLAPLLYETCQRIIVS